MSKASGEERKKRMHILYCINAGLSCCRIPGRGAGYNDTDMCYEIKIQECHAPAAFSGFNHVDPVEPSASQSSKGFRTRTPLSGFPPHQMPVCARGPPSCVLYSTSYTQDAGPLALGHLIGREFA
jgi:hypothetical protein